METETITDQLADITPELRGELMAHAAKSAPDEACGFIVKVGNELKLFPSKNLSSEPTKYFRTDPDTWEEAEDAGEIVYCYHSHYNHSANPSEADKSTAEKHRIKMLVFSYPVGDFVCYTPHGWIAPLVGRDFAHGIQDCYELIKDGYKIKKDIELLDFDRPDNWWLPVRRFEDGTEKRSTIVTGKIIAPALNLFLDNYARAGFRKVDGLELMDVIAMQVSSDVPNHLGIYWEEGLMLHHLYGRKSKIDPYIPRFGYYGSHTFMILRHESNPNP